MASKKKSQSTMLAHSRAKVEFYASYLERYLPIMSLTPYIRTIYIYDVFCGGGVYDNGGEGSPVRALKAIVKAKQNHPSEKNFILRLNDYNTKSINSVKDYIAKEIPGYKQYCSVQFASVDAEVLFEDMCDKLANTQRNERNLIFIDPYGYKEIHKEILERLMLNGKTEIILFLPVSFMHRFSDYSFDPDASEGVAPLREFIEEFFPEGHTMRCRDAEMNVHDYINNLKEAFSYGGRYYTASYEIEREKGHFFALFFMTSNLLGFEKILEVKWNLDEEDGKGFRLAKESPQASLFDDFFAKEKKAEHSQLLQEYIVDYLQKPHNNGEMYKFVMKKGYTKSHAAEILKQLQEEGRLDVFLLESGMTARKGSFYINYEGVSKPKVRYELKKAK